MKAVIMRKIIASSISLALYPFIVIFVFRANDADPNLFLYVKDQIDGIFGLFIIHTVLLLIYGLPVSIGIEFLTNLIYRIPILKPTYIHAIKFIISLLLHLFFGLILNIFSIVSALTLFTIDFILQLTKRKFTYVHALISLLLPLGTALLVYLNTTNW